MTDLLKNGYKAMKRPSGHNISEKFSINNGASIPPNLIAIANTESNSYYLRYCRDQGLEPHPARYPSELPEYFMRMLTDPGDLVLDPFAGSCVTGEVAERLKRRWVGCDLVEGYLKGALGRFQPESYLTVPPTKSVDDEGSHYRLGRPGLLWNGASDSSLALDGGKVRRLSTRASAGSDVRLPQRPTA
jgi:site-specific DNA-methyltransferase (cytosine-N4-specific)